MKILVVDDGQLAINSLIRILCRVAPDCDYISAMTTEDALSWMRQGPMDAAFLNLEMPGMNGLALTRMIQKLQPRCNIIVVTEHPEYALEALQIFVSGFLLKPANEADVRNVLEHLRYPPENAPVGIKIQCFGNFEIFVGGRALAFKRSKSKELLAYLVDRNGATCTNGEMLAVLWEDKPDTASLHSHLRNLIFDLSHTLEDAGVTGLLIRGRSTLALDTSKVDCDYYNFLRGSRSATNFYRGEYMTQYSWAGGDPFSTAPAGKCAENSLDPQLLCAAYRLLNQKKTRTPQKIARFSEVFFLDMKIPQEYSEFCFYSVYSRGSISKAKGLCVQLFTAAQKF